MNKFEALKNNKDFRNTKVEIAVIRQHNRYQ